MLSPAQRKAALPICSRDGMVPAGAGLAVLLGPTYGCAVYLLLRPAAAAPAAGWSPGWTALLGSLVLFGFAFLLHRIDFHKSSREGGRRGAANRTGTPLIWKTLHALWHILAAAGTAALFYALLYPDIAAGTC